MLKKQKPVLVAKSDGFNYSFRNPEGEWVNKPPSSQKTTYTPFKGYTPQHLKNLRRGCKLFLSERWPGYVDTFKKP